MANPVAAGTAIKNKNLLEELIMPSFGDSYYHAVADFTILIREAIEHNYDWTTFQALTAPMRPEIKIAVWDNLEPDERAYIQALKAASVPVPV